MENVKVYVPDTTDFPYCYVYGNNVIRCYKSNTGLEVEYVDYFTNMGYLERTGTSSIRDTINFFPSERLTTDYIYRLDFPLIILEFFFFAWFLLYIPIKILSKLFKGGGF